MISFNLLDRVTLRLQPQQENSSPALPQPHLMKMYCRVVSLLAGVTVGELASHADTYREIPKDCTLTARTRPEGQHLRCTTTTTTYTTTTTDEDLQADTLAIYEELSRAVIAEASIFPTGHRRLPDWTRQEFESSRDISH